MEPPDPISNSEVKRVIADGSVGSPHVRVGQCQAPNTKAFIHRVKAFLFLSSINPEHSFLGSESALFHIREYSVHDWPVSQRTRPKLHL